VKRVRVNANSEERDHGHVHVYARDFFVEERGEELRRLRASLGTQ